MNETTRTVIMPWRRYFRELAKALMTWLRHYRMICAPLFIVMAFGVFLRTDFANDFCKEAWIGALAFIFQLIGLWLTFLDLRRNWIPSGVAFPKRKSTVTTVSMSASFSGASSIGIGYMTLLAGKGVTVETRIDVLEKNAEVLSNRVTDMVRELRAAIQTTATTTSEEAEALRGRLAAVDRLLAESSVQTHRVELRGLFVFGLASLLGEYASAVASIFTNPGICG